MPETREGTRRVFVACCLGPEGAGKLTEWSENKLRALGLRTSPAEHLHATMFFAAAATDEAVESMSETLASVIWTPVGCLPGTLRIFGRNAVGLTLEWVDSAGVGLARAMATAISNGDSPTDPLSRSLRNLAVLFATFGDVGRPWHPHVTMARAPKAVDLGRLRLPRPPSVHLNLDHLALYESRLTPAGPEYRVLARSPEL